jgi:sterol desaturase/sphingolipid hydroxylase (fatty acid hydroxylase superfamily)
MNKNPLSEEDRRARMADTNRMVLAFLLFIFLAGWFAFIAIMIYNFGMGFYEGLGFGTVTGVLLAAFKDMWQFFFRKAGGKK